MGLARRRLRRFGFGLIGLAGVLGFVALQHIAALAARGHICGGGAPHCPACPASLAALALGTWLLGMAAWEPRRGRVRIAP